MVTPSIFNHKITDVDLVSTIGFSRKTVTANVLKNGKYFNHGHFVGKSGRRSVSIQECAQEPPSIMG